MRRWLTPALAVVAVGAGACGSDGPRVTLTTPPERKGAEPLPEIRARQEAAMRAARKRPTAADARSVRPILRGWARALRRNDATRAAEYFAVPVIVAQGAVIRLKTEAQVRAFNLALPCGVRLLGVGLEGRYIIGRFRLTPRPQHVCRTPGEDVRVAFVMRARRIAEWRQIPDVPGAPPGPDRPEDAPPPPPERVA